MEFKGIRYYVLRMVENRINRNIMEFKVEKETGSEVRIN